MLHSSLCMFRITAGLQTVMSPFWRWRHRTHTRLRPLWTGWWRCNVHPSDCPCDSPWRTVRTSCSTTEKTESGTQDVFKHEEDHSKLLPLASRCNTPGTSTERLDLTCDIVLMSKSNRLRSRIKTRGGFTIRHSWVTQDALSQTTEEDEQTQQLFDSTMKSMFENSRWSTLFSSHSRYSTPCCLYWRILSGRSF